MYILLFAVFINFVGAGLMLPLLPFYAAHYGASVLEITLLIALHPALAALASPIMGRLSDVFGRKPLLVFSLFVEAGAFIWFAFAPDLLHLFLARALIGCSAASGAIAQAYMADVTDRSQRTVGLSRIGAAISLGFVAGPLLGGLLSGDGSNFQLPCFVAAAAAALAAILCLFLKSPVHDDPSTSDTGKPIPSLWEEMSKPAILYTLVLMMIVTYVFTQFIAILPIWLDAKFGWTARHVGYAISLLGLTFAIVQGLLIGPANRRYGPTKTLTLSIPFASAALILIPFADTGLEFMIFLTLFSIGAAAFHPSLQTLISLTANAANQGGTLGAANGVSSLVRVIAPPLGGLIFAGLGMHWPLWTAAGVLFCGLLILPLLHSKLREGEVEQDGLS